MKWFRLIATLLLAWATTGPGTARAMTYAVESGVPLLHNYAPADYAAAPQNWAVVQDHRGVVYVGNSDDGVLEFDGNHWRRITIPNQSAVLSLAVDANGRVYVGAVNELGYLAPDAQGSMHYVSMRDRIAPKFRNFSEVRRIFINSDGVYFQTSEQLLRIRGTRIDAWMPRKSFHLAFQVDDQIYIREDGRGLLKLIGDRLEPVPGGERFAEEKVYVMVPWEPGSTLVGTRTQGWFVYDGHHFRAWPTEADNAFKRDQIYKAQWLADGTLAVATLQGGLSLLDRHGHIVEHLRRSDGLINDTVLALSQDRQNGLWLALDKGISRLDVATPLTHFTQGSGLDGTVLALQRHQGVLYAGTTKGLFRLQQASDGNARFSLIPGIQAQVWAFLDLGDTLLVATSQGLFETRAGVVLPCPTGPCLSADFNSSLLRSRWDPSRIFIGLRNGVASIRREQGRWINEGNINGDTGLIRSMAEDAKGNLWLGTVNNGAIRIALPADWPKADAARPQLKSFERPGAVAPDSNYTQVKYIAGELRFATARGIFSFDDKHQKLVADPDFAQLFAQGQRQVLQWSEGAAGRVWMYTADNSKGLRETGYAEPDKYGIYHWKAQPLQALTGVEMYAIHSEPDGVTWFSFSDGLYRHDQRVSQHIPSPLPTLLRKVSDSSGHILWNGAGKPTTPTLAWGNNNLRFDYAAPNFSALGASHFQVMMQGVDTQWSVWSTETYREYTNLHEGHYHFRVRTRDVHGHIGGEANYAFLVLPPWYRTWWAYLSYLALMLFIVGLSFRLRSAVLHRRNHELTRLVELRTEELSSSHLALQKANTRLRKLTVTDTLTGLKNRRYVLDHIAADLASIQNDRTTPQAGLLFLLIDIDHFKDVNDHYGHAAGDRVLEQMRDILASATRGSDMLVRWGGEEFLVVARYADNAFATTLAERIRRTMANHRFDLDDGIVIQRTCSIGFASYPVFAAEPDYFNWEDVVRLADQCLYAAKHNGRNSWAGVFGAQQSVADASPLSPNLSELLSEGYLRLRVSPSAPPNVPLPRAQKPRNP